MAITNYYKRHHPFSQSKTLSTEQLITFKTEENELWDELALIEEAAIAYAEKE